MSVVLGSMPSDRQSTCAKSTNASPRSLMSRTDPLPARPGGGSAGAGDGSSCTSVYAEAHVCARRSSHDVAPFQTPLSMTADGLSRRTRNQSARE
eukprot:3848907-Prymnesium_polylepis.2